MPVRVASKRAGGVRPRSGELVIAIDRHSGSALSNRHFMGCESRRAAVIDAFRADLAGDWRSRGPMRREIERIADIVRKGKDVALLCWCAPKPCHGDMIKKAIDRLAGLCDGTAADF